VICLSLKVRFQSRGPLRAIYTKHQNSVGRQNLKKLFQFLSSDQILYKHPIKWQAEARVFCSQKLKFATFFNNCRRRQFAQSFTLNAVLTDGIFSNQKSQSG
jgi:hypothetical protein